MEQTIETQWNVKRDKYLCFRKSKKSPACTQIIFVVLFSCCFVFLFENIKHRCLIKEALILYKSVVNVLRMSKTSEERSLLFTKTVHNTRFDQNNKFKIKYPYWSNSALLTLFRVGRAILWTLTLCHFSVIINDEAT